MTPAWGKCCTQFYQHNGRKRNGAAAADPTIAENNRKRPSYRDPPSGDDAEFLKTRDEVTLTRLAKRIRPKGGIDVEVRFSIPSR